MDAAWDEEGEWDSKPTVTAAAAAVCPWSSASTPAPSRSCECRESAVFQGLAVPAAATSAAIRAGPEARATPTAAVEAVLVVVAAPGAVGAGRDIERAGVGVRCASEGRSARPRGWSSSRTHSSRPLWNDGAKAWAGRDLPERRYAPGAGDEAAS